MSKTIFTKLQFFTISLASFLFAFFLTSTVFAQKAHAGPQGFGWASYQRDGGYFNCDPNSNSNIIVNLYNEGGTFLPGGSININGVGGSSGSSFGCMNRSGDFNVSASYQGYQNYDSAFTLIDSVRAGSIDRIVVLAVYLTNSPTIEVISPTSGSFTTNPTFNLSIRSRIGSTTARIYARINGSYFFITTTGMGNVNVPVDLLGLGTGTYSIEFLFGENNSPYPVSDRADPVTITMTPSYTYPTPPAPTTGVILGRIFHDPNNNGAWEPNLGEYLIRDPDSLIPDASCDLSQSQELNEYVVHIRVTESRDKEASECNPQPYYTSGDVLTGQYTLSMTLPPLWVVTKTLEEADDPAWIFDNTQKTISGNLPAGLYKNISFGVGKLPTCTLTATPFTIKVGETVSITFTSQDAIRAFVGNEQAQGLNVTNWIPSRTFTLTPTSPADTTIVVRVENAVGNNTCQVTVNIDPADQPPPCGTLGDVDRDGMITVEDANLILRYKAGLEQLDDDQKIRADVNGDGIVNAVDSNMIQRYLSGAITEFSACSQPTPPPESPPPEESPPPPPVTTVRPNPCQDAVETEKLTDNYVTKANGEAPITKTVTASGSVGQTVTLSGQDTFAVDFSRLQALFGYHNSDYLEGEFQSENQGQTNLLQLESQDLNKFYGPINKTTPRTVLDQQKVRYVQYVLSKPSLPEVANIYSDYENAFPKNIKQLFDEFGSPNPPLSGQDRTAWSAGWGRYWSKLPTAYSELYKGKLDFNVTAGQDEFTKLKEGVACAPITVRTVEFNVPDFGRTTLLSDVVNQTIVPHEAQSFRDHRTLSQGVGQAPPSTFLGKAVDFCKKVIISYPKEFLKGLQKTVKTTFNFLKPIKPVYAQPSLDQNSGPTCYKITYPGVQGVAPYCALPASSLGSGDSCTNSVSENKLNKDNPNVICTFSINWSINHAIDPNDTFWDTCADNGGGNYTCTTKLRIFPNFRIPWLAEIWNNTIYSDTSEGNMTIQGAKDENPDDNVKGTTAVIGGVSSPQETGRPGIFSYFLPKILYNRLFPGSSSGTQEALDLFYKCFPDWPDSAKQGDMAACQKLIDLAVKATNEKTCKVGDTVDLGLGTEFNAFLSCISLQLNKNLPGEAPTQGGTLGSSSSLKERLIGATHCAKHGARDLALKPEALQEELGISQACPVFAQAPSETKPPSGGDTGPPPLPGNCTPASDGNASNGIETSPEELVCYIIAKASDKVEPITQLNMAQVLQDVMFEESGGEQCSVGTAGEIGIFQYTAETWKGSGPNVANIDSGSGTYSNNKRQGRFVCWGLPGPDPVGVDIYAGDNRFNWSFQFGGNNDKEAWSPYLQIDNSIRLFERAEACRWTTFRNLYGLCN